MVIIMKKQKLAFFLLTFIAVSALLVSVFSLSTLREIKKGNESLRSVCSELQGRLSVINQRLGNIDSSIELYGESLLAGSESQVSAEVSVYVVREHGGIIGVFDKDGSLLKSVNTAVATLSEEDQKKLGEGIIVCSTEELGRILADLS